MKHGSFVQSLAIAIGNAIGVASSSALLRVAPLARIFAPIVVLFFSSTHAQAAQEIPTAFALEGVLYDSPTGTTTLLDPAASVRVQILNPAGTCILYDETQAVDTSASDGVFSIQVGSVTGAGKRTGGSDPGNTMVTVFQNSSAIPGVSAPSQTCAGNSYTPAAGAARLLRITVTPSATGTPDTLVPDMYLGSVPTALVAERAENLQGRTPASFLQLGTTTELTQANFENIFSNTNYPNLDALVDGTSTQYIQRDTTNGAEIPSLGAAPATPSAGNVWFNTSNNSLQYYDGSSVVTVGSGGGGGGSGDFLADGSIPMTGTLKMGGNTIYGNSTSGGSLTLDSTSNATKGDILLAPSGGFVGIGTTDAQRQLHIAASDSGTPSMLAFHNTDTGNSSGVNVSFRTDTSGTGATTFSELAALLVRFEEHDHATRSSSMRFHTAVAGTLAERMRISSAGNLGVGTTSPNSKLHVDGAISTALNTKTANYTLTASDSVILADATSGTITMTLPTAVGIAGRQYTIKKIDSSANAVSVATTSSQTIDALSTAALTDQYEFMTFLSDGANWMIIGASPPLATGSGTPNAFSFTDQTSQPLNSLVASNSMAITGFVGTLVASVSGSGSPEISIDGGAWTISGAIQSGQTLQVRLTTSGSVSTARTATVAVGSVTTNWQVTTRSGSLVVFTTTSGYTGSTIGGLTAADAICQAEANTAGYAGSYKAILSSSTTSAASRLTLSYPIVNAYDGTTVAATNLWVGSITTGIKTRTGGLAQRAWTGSVSSGAAHSDTCGDWTTNSSGSTGYSSFTTSAWIRETSVACSNTAQLYCIQQ